MMMERGEITFEEVEKFYNFLQGEVPPELHMKRPPRLSGIMAFRIIYYLQEVMGVIPDKYERCARCGHIFDSEAEGGVKSGRNYCGGWGCY